MLQRLCIILNIQTISVLFYHGGVSLTKGTVPFVRFLFESKFSCLKFGGFWKIHYLCGVILTLSLKL